MRPINKSTPPDTGYYMERLGEWSKEITNHHHAPLLVSNITVIKIPKHTPKFETTCSFTYQDDIGEKKYLLGGIKAVINKGHESAESGGAECGGAESNSPETPPPITVLFDEVLIELTEQNKQCLKKIQELEQEIQKKHELLSATPLTATPIAIPTTSAIPTATSINPQLNFESTNPPDPKKTPEHNYFLVYMDETEKNDDLRTENNNLKHEVSALKHQLSMYKLECEKLTSKIQTLEKNASLNLTPSLHTPPQFNPVPPHYGDTASPPTSSPQYTLTEHVRYQQMEEGLLKKIDALQVEVNDKDKKITELEEEVTEQNALISMGHKKLQKNKNKNEQLEKSLQELKLEATANEQFLEKMQETHSKEIKKLQALCFSKDEIITKQAQENATLRAQIKIKFN